MAVNFKWPWLGVIIPCALIAGIGYGSHIFVFTTYLSSGKQITFQVLLSLLWLSYYLAIVTDAGTPPKNFQPPEGEWKRWCKKCQNYKPERSHHCKTCKKCVLKMDHHCPWTYNCVGHSNLPHFLRFLVWVMVCTTFVAVELGKVALKYYENRNLPSYLVNKVEMFAVILLLPLDIFVFASILILFIRCVINLAFKGMTQIEVWELERIESQIRNGRIWTQIKKNYRALHGKEMPKLVSWSKHSRFYEEEADLEEDDMSDSEGYEYEIEESIEEDEDAVASNVVSKTDTRHDFTSDDLIFPYDLGFWRNLTDASGSPLVWLFPWGKPRTLGYLFIKNEDVEEDQLGLPWPPDGGHQENLEGFVDELDSIQLEDLSEEGKRRKLMRIRDPRSTLRRTEWMNDLGETLDDFGVDLDAEDSENDLLLAK